MFLYLGILIIKTIKVMKIKDFIKQLEQFNPELEIQPVCTVEQGRSEYWSSQGQIYLKEDENFSYYDMEEDVEYSNLGSKLVLGVSGEYTGYN